MLEDFWSTLQYTTVKTLRFTPAWCECHFIINVCRIFVDSIKQFSICSDQVYELDMKQSNKCPSKDNCCRGDFRSPMWSNLPTIVQTPLRKRAENENTTSESRNEVKVFFRIAFQKARLQQTILLIRFNSFERS